MVKRNFETMIHIYSQKKTFSLFLFVLLFFPVDLYSQSSENEDFLYNEFVFPDTVLFRIENKPLDANPYFLPVVFDGKLADDFSIPLPESPIKKVDPLFLVEKIRIPLFEEEEMREEIRRKAYRDLIRNRIDLVEFSYLDFPEEIEKIEEIRPNIFQSLFNINLEFENNAVDKSARFIPKRLYWITHASSLLQFSQSYISDNWYKGGIGNHNLLSVQNFTANYKKGKIQFNNFIEWKLSFYTNPNDTIRNFKVGEDVIRTYSDFGFTAFKNWSYSTNIEMKTQFFKSYQENSQEYISSFLSPIQVNMGILGMKYQIEKKDAKDIYKKFNFSADISPLSVQYTKIFDNKVDPTRFGIEEGKNSIMDIGSTMNSKLTMNINKQISFSSRFKYFTNYEKVIIELENELNMSVINNFSTRLYVFARFDDSPEIARDNKLGYIQVNELLSFGFNYKW